MLSGSSQYQLLSDGVFLIIYFGYEYYNSIVLIIIVFVVSFFIVTLASSVLLEMLQTIIVLLRSKILLSLYCNKTLFFFACLFGLKTLAQRIAI